MRCLLECSLRGQPATTEWRHSGNLQQGPTRKRTDWQWMTSKGQRRGAGIFWRSSEGGFILVEKMNETTSSQNPRVTSDFLIPRQRRDTVEQLMRCNTGVDQTRQTEVMRALIRWQFMQTWELATPESGFLGKVICFWHVSKRSLLNESKEWKRRRS